MRLLDSKATSEEAFETQAGDYDRLKRSLG